MRAVLEPCKLTHEQEEQWAAVQSMMVWACPGFRHIFYKLLTESHTKGKSQHTALMSKHVPIAATDGKNIILNPDTFFDNSRFDLGNRAFIIAHEVIHNVYGDVELLHRCRASGKVPMHDGTSLPFDMHTMQKVMDYRINGLLIASKIGKPPKEGSYDEDCDGSESVLDLYKKHYVEQDDPDEDGDGGDGDEDGEGDGNADGDGDGADAQGNNPGGFDELLPPGKSTGQNAGEAANQRNPQQWQLETQQAQAIEEMARGQGKMHGALKRMFEQILEPEVNWIDHIQTIVNRVGGSGGWNWKEPDEWWSPHDFFQPRKTGRGAGHIVIGGDVSGSRNDAEVASSIGEIAGIMEDLNPARCTLLWFDDGITYIDEIEDVADLRHVVARGVGGGGGTTLDEVMEWMASQPQKPDLFICFTDGFLDKPPEPSYPVIWASTTDQPYPYGEIVRVNKRNTVQA